MLLEIEKTVVEGAGAVGLAALMKEPRALRRQEGRPGPVRRQHRAAGAGRDHRARHGQVGPARRACASTSATSPARSPTSPRCSAGLGANIDEVQHQRAFTSLVGRAGPDRGRRADARRGARRRRSSRRCAPRATTPSASADRARPPTTSRCAVASFSSPRPPCSSPEIRSWPPPDRPPRSFAHEEGGAVALALAMAEGRATSERIVRDCLARIEAIDRHGPAPAQRDRAQPRGARDRHGARRRAQGAAALRGPLHGVPVLVKDNIATGDRMSTIGRLAGASTAFARRATRTSSSGCATPAR